MVTGIYLSRIKLHCVKHLVLNDVLLTFTVKWKTFLRRRNFGSIDLGQALRSLP